MQRSHRLTVGGGVVLLLVGAQVVGVLALIASTARTHPPAGVSVGAGAAAAVGWVLAGLGRLSPTAVLRNLRGAPVEARVGLVAAAVATSAASVVLAQHVPFGASAAWLVPLAQVGVTGLGFALLRRPAPVTSATAEPWIAAQALIVAFLAASLITAVARLDGVYPIARFPMYAAARAHPYEAPVMHYTGYTTDGREVALRPPAFRTVASGMADREPDRFERLVVTQAANARGVVRVVAVRETVAITSYPQPVGANVVGREVLVDVEVPR
jgi:hypothetical protein